LITNAKTNSAHLWPDGTSHNCTNSHARDILAWRCQNFVPSFVMKTQTKTDKEKCLFDTKLILRSAKFRGLIPLIGAPDELVSFLPLCIAVTN